MDYKKKYYEAQKWIESIYPELSHEQQMEAEAFFPELQESEDEKIREMLIRIYKKADMGGEIFGEGITYKQVIAWLEKQGEPQDKGEISDGYHTFNELYYYRMLYNAAFFNMLPKEWVHKSKKHHDGEDCFGGGWFIVMANLPTGQISNHYELKDWDLFQIPEKEVADKWDGHTPQEAADRLHKYLLEKQDKQPSAIRWYDVSLIPQEMEELLVEWDSEDATWHEIAFYHADTKTFWNGTRQVENVTRWCYITDLLEKQGEQKPTDKIEPKFHEGDWVVINGFTIPILITDVRNDLYDTIFANGEHRIYDTNVIDKDAHLWTIQDAKDGDVLYCKSDCGIEFIVMSKGINNRNNIDSYFRYNSDDGFGIDIPNVLSAKQDNITPATKEQRDILFQKMKEAGFEWDSEKKELKKISQRMISAKAKEAMYDKPTDNDMVEALCTEYEKGRADAFAEMQKEWSEDDEKRLQSCINILKAKSLMGKVDTANTMWLKSLKQRIGWKPSEDQMKALAWALSLAKNCGEECAFDLRTLYEQLEKLKG